MDPGHHQPQQSQPCKSGCGFYGQAVWGGYCSQCHSRLQEAQPSTPPRDSAIHRNTSMEDVSKLGAKKPDNSSATIGKFFKRTNSSGQGHKRSASSGGDAKQLPVADLVGNTFAGLKTSFGNLVDRLSKDQQHYQIDVIKDLKKPAAQDCGGEVTAFLSELDSSFGATTVDAKSEAFQAFYTRMRERMDVHPAWSSVTHDEKDAAMDALERHITGIYYDRLFGALESDEEKDLALQAQIRRLRWIKPIHLEVTFNPACAEAVEQFHLAQEELILLDAQRAPLNKLECMIRCSKAVFKMLQLSAEDSTRVASADDFLPALIYTIIQANPPLLHSNLQFISRFGNPSRLMTGEGGYYYTNIVGAVTFLETVNGPHLKMTDDEFQRRMQGTFTEGGRQHEVPESIQTLQNCMERLRRLSAKQRVLHNDVNLLMEAIKQLCSSSVQPIRRHSSVDIDAAPATVGESHAK